MKQKNIKNPAPIAVLIMAVILFATVPLLHGQAKRVTEMIGSVKNAGKDTATVGTLLSICDSLYRTKPDDAILFGNRALEISNELEYRKGQAYALKYLGIGHFVKGEYLKSIEYFQQALDLFGELNDKKGVANMLSNLGVIHNNQGNDAKALDLYLRSLKLSEEIGDSVRVLTAMINIGLIYSKKEATLSEARDMYLKALSMSERMKYMDAVGTVAVNLGELYYNREDYNEALKYFDKALQAYRKTSTGNTSYALLSIGKIYARWKDYKSAIKYQEEALGIAEASDSKLEIAQSALSLARTYMQMGEMGKAVEYLKKAETITTGIGAGYERKESYEGLSRSFSAMGDYKNAWLYQLRESQLKDTLFSEANQLQINNLKIQYEIETMLKENEILKRDVELKEASGRLQKTVIFFLVLGFISILIFLALLARANNQKRKANEDLNRSNGDLKNALEIVNHQKEEIHSAHEEIKASIRYAKYIQSSVLPKSEQLVKCLGDHFIFHRPKEIVSGDFYWVADIGSETVIAVADCTGHGVPGAFMSMLGMTLLNEIVSKKSITDPGIILDNLRAEVTSSLKQKGERLEQKDGMDITICTVDRKNMKLRFAGAINPLYLLRKRENTVYGIQHKESDEYVNFLEVKGDAMPIGIVDEMSSFNCHEIDIFHGDTFYMFSDGFSDQFGGPDHKRLSYRRFRQFLAESGKESMSAQRNFIESSLQSWMGNESQTDDILVVGFRIS